jgi:DNA-binding winged helix-turn-helix (wHTH) protein/serine/threonine protein kinase
MQRTTEQAGSCLYRYRFGAAQFDESKFELTVGGLSVEIEPKPLQVLVALLRRPGELVLREALLEGVWAERITVDQVLTNAVAKLRKALGEVEGARIMTVPRGGYRFDGPLERTAISTRLTGVLALRAGDAVPGRESFVLQTQLASSAGAEVWLAKHSKTEEVRVYKFARDAQHLSTLKREATLYRVLRESLGTREDLLRILDWNFETAPFYLECAYGGPNLLRWSEEAARLASMPRRERIGLFLQIADAVAAAHQVGVLHKDLKPTNILVATRPDGGYQAQIADFGSGRLLDPDRLQELGITRLGLTLTRGLSADSGSGTPLYLAPELIGGAPPTVQSDVFALGLILYQLLNADLRKPMAPGWEQDVADELLVEDIAAATQGDPSHRLLSVNDLTQRLRTLESRRVERTSARAALERAARAEQALQHARIRRPWIVTALVVLIVGVIVSALLYRNERLDRLQAQRESRRTEAINRFLSDDLLGAASPARGAGPNATVKEVLARAASTVDARFPNDPATRASIERALGKAYFDLSDWATAEKFHRRALSLLTQSEGADSPAALATAYELIVFLAQASRVDEATELLERTDRLAGRQTEGNSRLAMDAHWARANYYKLRLAAPQALAEFAATERVREVIDPDDENLLVRVRLAISWCELRLGHTEQAAAALGDLLAPNFPPERVGPVLWSMTRIEYGSALILLRRYEQAEQALIAARQELQHAFGNDNVFLANADNQLGELYRSMDRWSDAEGSYREAHRIFALLNGEQSTNALITLANLGVVEYRLGNAADAVQMLSPVQDSLRSKLGANDATTQSVAFYLASAQCALGQYAQASMLAHDLDPVQLQRAEPEDNWDQKLAKLREAIAMRRQPPDDAPLTAKSIPPDSR